jgi:hypothetical protein
MANTVKYEVAKGMCGKKSHWTVIADGAQVACRSTRDDTFRYIVAAGGRTITLNGKTVKIGSMFGGGV